MVGRLLSFWEGLFSGAMLNSRGVYVILFVGGVGKFLFVQFFMSTLSGLPTPLGGWRTPTVAPGTKRALLPTLGCQTQPVCLEHGHGCGPLSYLLQKKKTKLAGKAANKEMLPLQITFQWEHQIITSSDVGKLKDFRTEMFILRGSGYFSAKF